MPIGHIISSRCKMINIQQIQSKIADAILRSGLTQTELAKKLNIRQSNISHYIKGNKIPSLDTFANLCAILDLDTNDILCLSSFNKNETI